MVSQFHNNRYLTIAIYLLLVVNWSHCSKNVQQFIGTETMEAENYSSAENSYATLNNCDDPNDFYVGLVRHGTVLVYDQVQFEKGVKRVTIRLSNYDYDVNGILQMHLDSTNSTPFVTITVPYTGSDRCDFVITDLYFDDGPSGVHDLFLTIPSDNYCDLSIDWFVFNETEKTFVATKQIEAENFTSEQNVGIYNDCQDKSITYCENFGSASVLRYNQVEFGNGVKRVILRAGSNFGGQNISFHLTSSNSTPFLNVTVSFTGYARCDFSTFDVDLDFRPSGVQNLYLTFPSQMIYLDWFVFNQTGNNVATEKIEAEDLSSGQNYLVYNDCSDNSIYYVGELGTTSVLEYDPVDFGSGVQMVTIRVSNSYESASLDVAFHVGSSTNAPIVTLNVGRTGSGNCDFYTLQAFLDSYPSGVQSLFVTFPSTAATNYIHLDWFVFNATTTNFVSKSH